MQGHVYSGPVRLCLSPLRACSLTRHQVYISTQHVWLKSEYSPSSLGSTKEVGAGTQVEVDWKRWSSHLGSCRHVQQSYGVALLYIQHIKSFHSSRRWPLTQTQLKGGPVFYWFEYHVSRDGAVSSQFELVTVAVSLNFAFVRWLDYDKLSIFLS